MKTQATSELSDTGDWLVEHVDPTGWLAAGGTATAPARIRGSEVGSAQVGAQVDGAQVRTVDPRARVRRAGGRSRDRSNGHLRGRAGADRVRRSVPAGRRPRIAARPAPAPVEPAERVEQDQSLLADAPAGYRMGRLARLTLTLTVVAAIAVVLSVSLTPGSAAPQLVDVTVAPGDSLWSIATRSAPDRDPRAVIDDIRGLNDLPGDTLSVGAVLRVPAAAQ